MLVEDLLWLKYWKPNDLKQAEWSMEISSNAK